MYGPAVTPGTPIMEAAQACFGEILPEEGPALVDYIIGAVPAAGVFVMATCYDPKRRPYLEYYKMGPGPVYCFYVPHHLCHLDVPNTVARAVLLQDAVLAPWWPFVDVIAIAKRDLKAGQVLDRIGGYTTYGLAENADVVRGEDLLPVGLAEGCTLRRDVGQDEVLAYADVVAPRGRLCDYLRAEQDAMFFGGENAGI